MLYEFFSQKLLIAPLLAAAVAQTIKMCLHWRRAGVWDWRWLFRDAGMPSAHTATVTALTFMVYTEERLTNLFFVTLIFSAIVIRNVIGDKIFAEKSEHALNELLQRIQHFFAGERVEWKHFIGHTIREVIAGFAVGVVSWYIVISFM